MNSNSGGKYLVMDEAASLLSGIDDRLRDELRGIDGIPNATYLVTKGQVFVFDLLVRLVKQRKEREPQLALAEFARGLVSESMVSACDAVGVWGVVPEPFEVVEHGPQRWLIRHRAFGARLPGRFHSKPELDQALARLLLGERVSGVGDFTYDGQPMTLQDPFDPQLLPVRPSIASGLEPVGYAPFSALAGLQYVPGLEPLTMSLFTQIQLLDRSWGEEAAASAQHARQHAVDLWALSGALELDRLSDPESAAPEFEQEAVAELRQHYPELAALSDGSLYWYFDDFQEECCYISGWFAGRDDDFLMYLLGKVVDPLLKGDECLNAGRWMGSAALRGNGKQSAASIARVAHAYDLAIRTLARHVADATRFLASDTPRDRHQGRPIRTLGDLLRINRKVAGPVVGAQNLVDVPVASVSAPYARVFDCAGSEAVESVHINPAARFGEESDFVMGIVQRIVGRTLSAEQYALAKHVGAAAAATVREATLLVLIDAWRAEPTLAAFAEELASAVAIPGGLGNRASSYFPD